MRESAKARIETSYGKLPLYFMENQGQVDCQVKYYSRARNHNIFFAREEVVLTLMKGEGKPATPGKDQDSFRQRQTADRENQQVAVVRLTPMGMRQGVEITGQEPQEAKFNYFIGNDPKKWRTNVPTYKGVLYREAYPGIDLKFYGTGQQVEYDLIIKPAADIRQVKFKYTGIKDLKVTPEGDLAIRLQQGEVLTQKRAAAYQEVNGRRVLVEARFRLAAGNRHTYGLEVAAYDRTRPLIIDPVLVYSTYLGGSSYDVGSAIALDSAGCVYLAGLTASADFPTTSNALQPSLAGDYDAFVAKLNPAGSALVFSTYLGGSSEENSSGIATDSSGNVYVTGKTASADFPTTPNALQPSYAGGAFDAYVAKLSPTGSALVYSTYLGGSDEDWGQGILVDGAGNANLTGFTWSSDFPTQNALQPSLAGCSDVFLAKLNAAGSALVYSTFLGGSSIDEVIGFATDSAGNLYVTGDTWSADFPTTQNALQPSFGGYIDGFVAKLNASCSALVFSTYLGGSSIDYGSHIAVDSAGNAYVTGFTGSTNFPTRNALQPALAGGWDAYVAKLNSTGSALVYSTYLGGSSNDQGMYIIADFAGNAYVTGGTWSTDFPTQNGFQSALAGVEDVFVAKLNPAGSAMVYSTYLGGSGADFANGMAAGSSGNIYVTGRTSSADFLTTPNALQPAFAGVRDCFLARIQDILQVPIDIKPGSLRNIINLRSKGTVPVAILSTQNFDTSTVVPESVFLSGAGVKLKGRGTPMASVEDVNGDGLNDLMVHVITQELTLTAGDTQAILTGETYDGVFITGEDSVRIVP